MSEACACPARLPSRMGRVPVEFASAREKSLLLRGLSNPVERTSCCALQWSAKEPESRISGSFSFTEAETQRQTRGGMRYDREIARFFRISIVSATAVNFVVLGLIAGFCAIVGAARADTSETAAENPMVAPVKRVAPRMPVNSASLDDIRAEKARAKAHRKTPLNQSQSAPSAVKTSMRSCGDSRNGVSLGDRPSTAPRATRPTPPCVTAIEFLSRVASQRTTRSWRS